MKYLFVKNIKKIYPSLVLFVALTLPRLVSGGNAGSIDNPINASSISDLVEMIIKIFIAVGTPIAVLFLIYSGFKFVTAQGKPDALKDARTTFVWTLVGIAILLGASVLAAVIEGTINQLGAGV